MSASSLKSGLIKPFDHTKIAASGSAYQAASDQIERIIAEYIPSSITALLLKKDIQIVPVFGPRAYTQASESLVKLKCDVDRWPSPPAGLFAIADRTLYIKNISVMSTTHELGHAFDLALGTDQYLSTRDRELKQMFKTASRFVSPYAATFVDEFFAESFRAMCSANDSSCIWQPVNPERLRSSNPDLFDWMTNTFERLNLGVAA